MNTAYYIDELYTDASGTIKHDTYIMIQASSEDEAWRIEGALSAAHLEAFGLPLFDRWHSETAVSLEHPSNCRVDDAWLKQQLDALGVERADDKRIGFAE